MPERPFQQIQPTQPNENQRSLSPSPSTSVAALGPDSAFAGTTGPTADGAMPTFDTEPNKFGLFRSYVSCPTYEPDEEVPLDSICDSEGFAIAKANSGDRRSVFGSRSPPVESVNQNLFAPFLSATVFRLVSWFYGSNTKSVTELDKLVNDVILPDDFDKAHLKGFNFWGGLSSFAS
jgi:hypothetical protein